VYFTIKPQEGIQATSFKPGDKFYIGGDKLLPLEKYDLRLETYPDSALIACTDSYRSPKFQVLLR
jgi:rRNA processing protein Gar1